MAETVLAKMAVEIAANTAGFQKALQGTQGQLKSFTTGLGDITKSVGIAFGISQVASFAFEVAKLSGEAQAVSDAFGRLPNSIQLMNDLKAATAGTVSELDLMKRSVQASNFGIELEALPKLLEFAAIRAQQTGQSVDYLVDSIVTGIGRKSPLILDNLGISAVALKEKMGGVTLAAASIGDVSRAVGQIASDELEKMGGFSENAATKVARLSASWENFKVVLGNVVTAGGLLEGVLDNLAGVLASLSNGDTANFTQFQKGLAQSIKDDSEPAIKSFTKELNALKSQLGTPISENTIKGLAKDFELNEEQSARFLKIVREINGEVKKVTPVKVAEPVQVTTLESLQDKLKELNEAFSQVDITNKEALITRGQEIISIGNQIKVLEDLRKQKEKDKEDKTIAPNSVKAYQKALQELGAELENVNVKDTDRIRVLSAQIAGYQDAIERVEKLKKSFQDFEDVTITPPDLSGLLNPVKEIQTVIGGISFTSVSDATQVMTDRIEENLKRMAVKTKETTTELSKVYLDFSGVVGSAASGIGEALGNAISGGSNFGKALLGVLGSVLVQLGQMLITAGLGIIGFKKALSSLNGYVALAAGIALVAIGTAVGASIKGLGGSGGGASGSSGGGATTPATGVSRFESKSPMESVQFNAEFKIRGNDLVAVASSQNNRNNRLGG